MGFYNYCICCCCAALTYRTYIYMGTDHWLVVFVMRIDLVCSILERERQIKSTAFIHTQIFKPHAQSRILMTLALRMANSIKSKTALNDFTSSHSHSYSYYPQYYLFTFYLYTAVECTKAFFIELRNISQPRFEFHVFKCISNFPDILLKTHRMAFCSDSIQMNKMNTRKTVERLDEIRLFSKICTFGYICIWRHSLQLCRKKFTYNFKCRLQQSNTQ